jgi:hypothetical protein
MESHSSETLSLLLDLCMYSQSEMSILRQTLMEDKRVATIETLLLLLPVLLSPTLSRVIEIRREV